MGEAKRRGTREERIAAAPPLAEKPEPQYRRLPPYTNRALDFLWGQFRIGDGEMTVNDIRAEAVAKQKELAAKRAAEEIAANPEGWLAKNTEPLP